MSFFRNITWYMKGMGEYTRSGYQAASKHFVSEDLNVDCAGRVYLITGANSGIGKEAAMEIAKRKGTIHMVCRNPKYADEAREELVRETGNEDIHVHLLDLSKTKDVVAFTKSFTDQQEKLDVLVNNAGCMVNSRELTDDGLEKNFATNSLGTFAMTEGLQSLMLKSSDPRVITVSSGGMLVQKLNVQDLQFEKMKPFDGTMAYAQNKRQQVIMNERWSLANPQIKYYCMHPGWSDTPAVQNSMPDFHRKMQGKLRTIGEGADTIVWLAIAEAAGKAETGKFWQDRRPVATHLPLAWTRANASDETELMGKLKEMTDKFS